MKARTAKQRAASKRNLEKARAASARKGHRTVPRSRYHGKMILGYHVTSPQNAKMIVRQGFRKGRGVYFVTNSKHIKDLVSIGAREGKDYSVLKFQVPFRKVKNDPESGYGDWKIAPYTAIRGIKIRKRLTR